MSLNHRYDFVLLFDVRDGNPNGEADTDNPPRLKEKTGPRLVADVSLMHKVRRFFGLSNGEQPPDEIYVKKEAALNVTRKRACVAIGREDALEGDARKRKGGDAVGETRDWTCTNIFDVRTFGAVMSLGVNCGQVRGRVQMTFARSADPVIAQGHAIARMAVATEAEAEMQDGDHRQMGRKHAVPYGLYRAHGFVSAFLARQVGSSNADLELLFQSLAQMFEHDCSAARGEMATRGLYVFKHASALGNAPAHALFDRLKVKPRASGDVARGFEPYEVLFDGQPVALGEHPVIGQPDVTLIRRC